MDAQEIQISFLPAQFSRKELFYNKILIQVPCQVDFHITGLITKPKHTQSHINMSITNDLLS